jgi:hypothetical protein
MRPPAIESVLLLAVAVAIWGFLFPGGRAAVASHIEQMLVDLETTNHSTSVEEKTITEEEPLKNTTETVNESLAPTTKQMQFRTDANDQAMRLGRSYSYDLSYLQENIHSDISSFHYIEDEFFDNKRVYFEIHDSYYTTTLND